MVAGARLGADVGGDNFTFVFIMVGRVGRERILQYTVTVLRAAKWRETKGGMVITRE